MMPLDLGFVVDALATGRYTLVRRTAGAYDPTTGNYADPTEVTSVVEGHVVPNATDADDEIPLPGGNTSTDRVTGTFSLAQLGGVAIICTDAEAGKLADRLLYPCDAAGAPLPASKTYEAINTLDYLQAGGFSSAQFRAVHTGLEGA